MVYNMSNTEIVDVIKAASSRFNLPVIEAVTSAKKRVCISVLVETDDRDKCMDLREELYDVYRGARAVDGSIIDKYAVLTFSDTTMPLVMVYAINEVKDLFVDKKLLMPYGLVTLCENSEWRF